MPSGHKAFLVNNMKDVELLMMHNRTYAAEYVYAPAPVDRLQDGTFFSSRTRVKPVLTLSLSQDRLQRLLAQAHRHHRPREAIRRQGDEPQGQGHDRSLRKGFPAGGRWLEKQKWMGLGWAAVDTRQHHHTPAGGKGGKEGWRGRRRELKDFLGLLLASHRRNMRFKGCIGKGFALACGGSSHGMLCMSMSREYDPLLKQDSCSLRK